MSLSRWRCLLRLKLIFWVLHPLTGDSNLYVTPLDERIKTFCLFLLIMLLAPSSFPFVGFDNDL
jgi:hypothetical protein